MEGTLTDSGPLFALLNRNDDYHERATAAIDRVTGPLLTTWPVVAETMYLLGESAGWSGQNALWTMIVREHLVLLNIGSSQYGRVRELMDRYKDLPMDLADGTLVAVAEQESLRRILSFDHHFHVYRFDRNKSFEVIP
jgi:uncharacterized protein